MAHDHEPAARPWRGSVTRVTEVNSAAAVEAGVVQAGVVQAGVGVEASTAGGELVLTGGGRVLRYPAIWLRDNCPCAGCADPLSGQKLHDITDIAPDCAVTGVQQTDNSKMLAVVFGPDGHVGEFSRGWLLENTLDGRAAEDDGRRLWDRPADLDLTQARWAAYSAEPGERERVLSAVVRDGFALLTGVPAEPGTVLTVAESFGFVRETNYGRLFDVRIEPAPGNLAFTSREILPHTDNPYRDPVPTLQLLHCLRVADEGGDTGLVDGFAAARALETENPGAYRTLTSTTVSFEYSDTSAELRTSRPLIQLGPGGQLTGVRFNNRSVRAIRLPYEQVTDFYVAYRRWAELLARPGRRLRTRLAPGDCLIFDNTRILHARTAFSVTGSRHLQGCYADMDGLASTLALLRRNQLRRTSMQEGSMIEELAGLFAGPGAGEYLGEPVTIGEHMRQAGALAQAAGAPDALVAAALLHDVGHLRAPRGAPPLDDTGDALEDTGDALEDTGDARHGEQGANWLGQWFGPRVTEPVRLHVAAKRYLCATEPGYFARLSAESVRTLALQGGPMSGDEVTAFRLRDYAMDAVVVRRWDDEAKEPAVTPPEFGYFAPVLARLATNADGGTTR
jgi:gamma-butyrobetaine dioxygenase